MSGGSVVVDTNVVIHALAGHSDLVRAVQGRRVHVSVVSELELLSYPSRDQQTIWVVGSFLSRVSIIDLLPGIKAETIRLRSAHGLRLSDAIIAATASFMDIPLLTTDKHFKKLSREVDLEFYQL